MKRSKPARRLRRHRPPRLRVLPTRHPRPRVDGRVALVVLSALGRLAQRLGPAA